MSPIEPPSWTLQGQVHQPFLGKKNGAEVAIATKLDASIQKTCRGTVHLVERVAAKSKEKPGGVLIED